MLGPPQAYSGLTPVQIETMEDPQAAVTEIHVSTNSFQPIGREDLASLLPLLIKLLLSIVF